MGGVGILGERTVILVDTNVIIEAVRTGCWNALRGHYMVVTVGKCREEAQSGIPGTRGYVRVEEHDLDTRLDVVAVTESDRAQLAAGCPDVGILDAGERDLWAHALSRGDDWRAVSADQAAVRIAMLLDWGDRLVSLEELLKGAGIRPRVPLKGHYTKARLESWRTKFRLEM